jgi:HK97 family phage major capsid protein
MGQNIITRVIKNMETQMESLHISDILIALHNYESKGIVDPRFIKTDKGLKLKSTAHSEVVPQDGGYTIGGEVISPLLHSISQKSSLFDKATKFYSSGPNVNKAFLPFVNETGRTDSAFQMHSYWIAEGADKTKAKFNIGLAECKLNKVYANMAITEELWSDPSSFRSSIDRFIADPREGSLVWKIDGAMLFGKGDEATGMYGIMGPSSNGTIGVAQADALDEATLRAFNAALTPASQATSEWYMSQENYIELQAITFANDGDKYYDNGHIYVYGKKVNVLEQMVAPYDLMLGDVSQYAIALKDGPLVQSASTIHVLFDTDERCIRWGIRINGKSFGSKYTLESGETVGTFVVPSNVPSEESSSSSSSSYVEEWSTSSESSSSSSAV